MDVSNPKWSSFTPFDSVKLLATAPALSAVARHARRGSRAWKSHCVVLQREISCRNWPFNQEAVSHQQIQRDFSGSKMGIANVPATRGPFKHQSPWDLETPVVKWEQRDLKVCPARWSPEKQIVSVRLQLSKFLRLWWM